MLFCIQAILLGDMGVDSSHTMKLRNDTVQNNSSIKCYLGSGGSDIISD